MQVRTISLRLQAARLEHGPDPGLRAQPRLVELGQVFRVATRKNHPAEAVAIGPREPAVIFEPLVGVVVEHLAPQIGVIAGLHIRCPRCA